MAVNKIKEIAVSTNEGNKRETLRRLAATAMSSKLIHRNADFFTKSMPHFSVKICNDVSGANGSYSGRRRCSLPRSRGS